MAFVLWNDSYFFSFVTSHTHAYVKPAFYSCYEYVYVYMYAYDYVYIHTSLSILFLMHFKVYCRHQCTPFILEIKCTWNEMYKALVYICSVLLSAFTIVTQNSNQDTEQWFSTSSLHQLIWRECYNTEWWPHFQSY